MNGEINKFIEKMEAWISSQAQEELNDEDFRSLGIEPTPDTLFIIGFRMRVYLPGVDEDCFNYYSVSRCEERP